jgi:serpin B
MILPIYAQSEPPPAPYASAVAAVNKGGEKIFNALPSEGNLCISPFSIQSALAMTYAGASGETRSQMAAAVAFPESVADLAKSFHALNAALLDKLVHREDPDVALSIANRLFAQAGYAFRPAFLETTSTQFGAPLEELDFKKSPPAAAVRINSWVEEKTRERIKNLIPADALDETTTLILANALYFKMPWSQEFPAEATRPQPFTNSDGKQSMPLFLNRTDCFGYAEDGAWKLVAVPFRTPGFQFVFFLPTAAGPLPANFPAAELLEKAAALPRMRVALSFPKFRLESPTLPLGKPLQKLGMLSAFDIPQGSANFDAMAPRKPDEYLYLSEVFHKTFLDLGEKGVEAAAATAALVFAITSIPIYEDPIPVTIDRPFYFAIQHAPSGVALFLGRITNLPSAP